MIENNVIFAVILMISAIACIILAIYMWGRRPAGGITWMILLLVALALWLITYMLEILSPDIEGKYLFSRLTFIYKTIIPVFWFCFALKYSGRERFLTSRNIILLLIVPVFANIAIWTNDSHGLIWSNVQINYINPVIVINKTPTIIFWLGGLYCYSMVIAGAIIITWSAVIVNMFNRNSWIVVAAVVLALFVNASTALRPDLVSYLEITPIVFTFCLCIGCWFAFRNRLLDLVPVARERLIEKMRDGMVVVNTQGDIIYRNSAARIILQHAAGKKETDSIYKLPCREALSSMVDRVKTIELKEKAKNSKYYEIQTSVLSGHDNNPAGYLINLHNVTERKLNEEQLEKYRNHLEDLVKQRTSELEEANKRLQSEVRERLQAVQAANTSEEKYRILVENASQAIVVVQDGFLKFVNPKTLELTGYTAQELESRYFLEIISTEDRDVIASHYLSKLSKERVEDVNPVRMVCKNGKVKWVELNVAAISWQGRSAVLNFFNDITERRTAEKRVRSSYEKLKNAMHNTIKVMSSIIELKDPYTAGHQSRVTELSCAIAVEMKLSREKIDGLRASSLVHDIGKITIPAEILSKPGSLNELEFTMIQKHSRVGYDILKQIDFDWPIAEIVLQHHERMNGSGYPQNLGGDQIIMEARILAVADVIEAMSSHRPYRPALGEEKALAEISQNRGILYDPEVVDTCVNLFREKAFSFPST